MRILIAIMLSLGCAAAVEVGDNLSELAVPLRSGASTVSAFAGKVVYLDVWATWCVPCRESLPWMDGLQARLKERGLEVIAVSIDKDAANLNRFLSKHPVSITIGHDAEAAIAKQLGVTTMPTAVVIDRAGKVHAVHAGFERGGADAVEAQIIALLETP
ncbi:MAG: TlpA disulfide reductase family protein [Planctomycetota bacterium]|jgi:cytochrome c biogenesis protein CcmG/thiol:disulfide interchange protein DsbE|nr:TlpA disulfide reductase family protein [Planctomycetota bacterium]